MRSYLWSRFLRNMFARRGRTTTRQLPARPRRPSARPRLEALEDRTLLSAQNYLVTVGGDAGVADPTDPTGRSGDIRYCIEQADQTGNAGSTINFSGTVGNLITLTHGELVVSQNMTITGPSASGLTISGGYKVTTINGFTFINPGSRVFDVTANGETVTIAGLTIADGDASPFQTTTPGNQGGDIFNGSTLILNNDVVKNGLAEGTIGGPDGRGGGIFNASGTSGSTGASLTINNTVIENNVAQGIGVFQGSVYVTGAGQGGGIYNDVNASVVVSGGTQIQQNQALGSLGGSGGAGGVGGTGGSIVGGTGPTNGGAGSPGTNGGLTGATGDPGQTGNSTTSAGGDGGAGGAGADGLPGGVGEGGGVFNKGTLTLSSTTFYDNVAQGGDGGAGGAGGKGGLAGKGTPGGQGGAGGKGGDGGDAGLAQGGGVFNTGTLAVIFQSQFT